MGKKNHVKVGNRLLQTDKKFSNLKMKQKDKIAEWEYEETIAYYMKHGKFPADSKASEEIIHAVYDRIVSADIWIPYYEIERHYIGRCNKLNERAKKQMIMEKHRIEKVIFMNMCMIEDSEGNVLALDKVNDNYSGTTFPGGHVEEGETFTESVIREIKEETGLNIKNPKLTGIYHWMKDGIRNVGYLYKATEFEGELNSSEEGKVYWISGEDFLRKPLAPGMLQVWQMMHDENDNEAA